MLKLVRPKNLLLIALLQCLILMRLGDYNFLIYDFSKTIALVLSTAFIAAAGYIINDYFDIKIDLINKPQQVVIGQDLSRRWAIILHITFTTLGLGFAYTVNFRTLLMAAFCALMLYVYSSSFKKKFLIGNIIIALLSALSVYICQCYIGLLNEIKILAYCFFAAISTLLREIIKDLEDEKGDAQFQSNSLAINLGLRRTKKILLGTSVLLLLSLIIYPIMALDWIYSPDIFFITYSFILIFGIGIPLILLIFRLQRADKQQDFVLLSKLMKIIMLIGIFSILFS